MLGASGLRPPSPVLTATWPSLFLSKCNSHHLLNFRPGPNHLHLHHWSFPLSYGHCPSLTSLLLQKLTQTLSLVAQNLQVPTEHGLHAAATPFWLQQPPCCPHTCSVERAVAVLWLGPEQSSPLPQTRGPLSLSSLLGHRPENPPKCRLSPAPANHSLTSPLASSLSTWTSWRAVHLLIFSWFRVVPGTYYPTFTEGMNEPLPFKAVSSTPPQPQTTDHVFSYSLSTWPSAWASVVTVIWGKYCFNLTLQSQWPLQCLVQSMAFNICWINDLERGQFNCLKVKLQDFVKYHFPVTVGWMNFLKKKAKYKLRVLSSMQLSKLSSVQLDFFGFNLTV